MINSQINASNLDETFQRFEINISRFSVEKEKRATADKREREIVVEQSRQPDRRRGFNFIAFSYDNLRKIPFVPQDERCNVSQDANRRRVIILFFFFFLLLIRFFPLQETTRQRRRRESVSIFFFSVNVQRGETCFIINRARCKGARKNVVKLFNGVVETRDV